MQLFYKIVLNDFDKYFLNVHESAKFSYSIETETKKSHAEKSINFVCMVYRTTRIYIIYRSFQFLQLTTDLNPSPWMLVSLKVITELHVLCFMKLLKVTNTDKKSIILYPWLSGVRIGTSNVLVLSFLLNALPETVFNSFLQKFHGHFLFCFLSFSAYTRRWCSLTFFIYSYCFVHNK